MSFEIQTFRNGSASILDLKYGETMHSQIGPQEEANKVYLEQAELEKRLLQDRGNSLVLFDVGLGMGTNALASIELFLGSRAQRNLHIVSFENNLSGIQFALQNTDQLPFIKRYLELVQTLLTQKTVTLRSPFGTQIYWELKEGDFRNHVLNCPSPEVIFYDFYSPRACPDLWSLSTFKLVYQSTAAQRAKGDNTFLCTYSSSTSVRSALVLAGFNVGHGNSTESKKETTVASTCIEDLDKPLDQHWLNHWLRSSKPMPEDAPMELYRKMLIERIQQI
jgi:queuine tRNA-ribosyltransferase